MICKCSVTFEFDTISPITHICQTKGSSARTVIARAIDDAVKNNPNLNWSSVVVCIERTGT